MTAFRQAWDRMRQKRARAMIVSCPSMDCREQVVVSLDSDRAKCSKCGREWQYTKSHLLRGER